MKRTFASCTWNDWGLGLYVNIGQRGFRYSITFGPISVMRLSADVAAVYHAAHAQAETPS